MIYLSTILWCVPSPLFMFLNAELWLLSNVTMGNGEPWLLAICCAIGQMIGYTACFFAGANIMERLPKLKAKVERVDAEKYRGTAYFVLLTGSIVGWPPAVVLTLLGSTLKYRFVPYFLVCATGRVIRFETIAALPETLAPLLRH